MYEDKNNLLNHEQMDGRCCSIKQTFKHNGKNTFLGWRQLNKVSLQKSKELFQIKGKYSSLWIWPLEKQGGM